MATWVDPLTSSWAPRGLDPHGFLAGPGHGTPRWRLELPPGLWSLGQAQRALSDPNGNETCLACQLTYVSIALGRLSSFTIPELGYLPDGIDETKVAAALTAARAALQPLLDAVK